MEEEIKEFLTSNLFRQYRSWVVAAVLEYVGPRIMSPDDCDVHEIRGAMNMARKILRIPAEMSSSHKEEEEMQKLVNMDIMILQSQFVSENLKGYRLIES